jgi:RNA polymerase sigma-70 factor, ECF subfamily
LIRDARELSAAVGVRNDVEATLRLARVRRERVSYAMSLAERLLISRLKQRDGQAFEEIVQLYGDKVFSLVYRMLGNRHEAEDVAQEVFITVFKTVDGFRGEAKFSTWLLRIAANQSKNRIKYLSRRPTEGEIDDALERGPAAGTPGPVVQTQIDGPDVLMEAAELEALMQRAIAALDEEHRLLVILRDVEELSYQEIGEITGLPEGTIKSRLHRARMAIKEELDRHTK